MLVVVERPRRSARRPRSRRARSRARTARARRTPRPRGPAPAGRSRRRARQAPRSAAASSSLHRDRNAYCAADAREDLEGRLAGGKLGELRVAAADLVVAVGVAAVDRAPAHRQRLLQRADRAEPARLLRLLQQVEVDLDGVDLLHAADVGVPERLVGVEERDSSARRRRPDRRPSRSGRRSGRTRPRPAAAAAARWRSSACRKCASGLSRAATLTSPARSRYAARPVRLRRWRAGCSGHRSCSPPSTVARGPPRRRARRPSSCSPRVALIPLAWLIGESTEHAAEHTGPGIGGFLNASFGNAPEIIIALLAIDSGLPNVVRGSLAGQRRLEPPARARRLAPRRRARAARPALAAPPARDGAARGRALPRPVDSRAGTGDPERHSLALADASRSRSVLLAVYAVDDGRRAAPAQAAPRGVGRRAARGGLEPAARARRRSPLATVATAFVSEILVHSLDAFAKAVGLSEFFIAVVVVAIVGNAAEHGGAIVISRRGKIRLASEIAVSSSAQVALLVDAARRARSPSRSRRRCRSRSARSSSRRWPAAALLVAAASPRRRGRRGRGRPPRRRLRLAMVLGYLAAGDR